MVKIDFTDEYKQLLWQIPLFRDLDVNVKHRLMDELEFTLYKVSRKEVVLQQDTRCNHLYVLLKGASRPFRSSCLQSSIFHPF